jgi:hypothetical protein
MEMPHACHSGRPWGDGDFSVAESTILKTIETNLEVQQIKNRVVISTNVRAPRKKYNEIFRISE